MIARGPQQVQPQHQTVEAALIEQINTLRAQDKCVTTQYICQKALSLDRSFHGGSYKALKKSWVYQFLHRHDFCLRRFTREGQKLSGHLQAQKDDFVASITERFKSDGTLCGLSDRLIINMDETPVYFEPDRATTVNKKGAKTASIRSSGQSTRCTAVLAVAADGTKLPPMVIFKAVPGGTIEKNLPSILPDGCVGTCEKKAFMNTRSMSIWTEKVLKPHVKDAQASLLLVDDYNPHKVPSVVNAIEKLGCDFNLIPGGYTCVLQPLDVGINRPFKHYIEEYYNQWAIDNIADQDKVPVPDRALILKWIHDAWNRVPIDTIVKTFKKVGYIK
jgi:hypothetical protein